MKIMGSIFYILIIFVVVSSQTPGVKDVMLTDNPTEGVDSTNDLRVLLIAGASVLRTNKNFIVKARVTNMSPSPIDLTKSTLSFRLEKTDQTADERRRYGKNYWAFAKKLERSSILPQETIELEFDLAQLKWGERFLSGFPSSALKKLDIEAGDYFLYLTLQVREKDDCVGYVKSFNSNEVIVGLKS